MMPPPSLRTDCICTAGLVNPPELPGKLSLVEERIQQYEAGELTFCDCELGQRAQRFYAERSANPHGKLLAEEARQRREAFLNRVDGLKPEERTLRLAGYRVGPHNRPAFQAVSAAVEKGNGLITLYGAYGVGKTALLMAAVNECRQQGWVSMYRTTADMLAWLRAGFDQSQRSKNAVAAGSDEDLDQSFDQRWRTLVACRCLALDELTAFSVTPWAAERFERLIDERWRSMATHLTVLAFNGDPNPDGSVPGLPGVVVSRLQDRRASWCPVGGRDMRKIRA